MTLHFSTFYAHVPDRPDAPGYHPNAPVSHPMSIRLINMLFGSARAFNRDARFSIQTSASTPLSGIDMPFRRIDIPVDRSTLMFDRTAGQRRMVAELPEDELLIMLDIDMIVQSDLSHLKDIDFDIALTWRPERQPINGGFIAARRQDGDGALRFFDDLLRLYSERSPEDRQWYGDQLALRELLPTKLHWQADMLTRPYEAAKVHFLHSKDYNFAPDAGEPACPEALGQRRLLHFKGKRKSMMPAYYDGLRRRHRAVLSPFVIPPDMAKRKAQNIGDGFILQSIKRLFGTVAKGQVLSPRIAPSSTTASKMRASDIIILAGANQLHDRYTIWPGLTADRIRSEGYRFLPVGIGIHGEPGMTATMSEETAAILRAMHERIEYSSWRCPMTVAYLEASLPELKGRFLMTGCPVIFDKPLLTSRRFHEGADHIALTITDRGENWFKREWLTMQAVHERFPAARKSMVLHQDFARLSDPAHPSPDDLLRHRLIEEARRLGFEIHIPAAKEAIAFYQSVDIHFGSRIHAHLLMLSRNRKSFVTSVDNRTLGLSRAFRFPILRQREMNIDEALAFDFEPIRERALRVHETMMKFVESTKALQ